MIGCQSSLCSLLEIMWISLTDAVISSSNKAKEGTWGGGGIGTMSAISVEEDIKLELSYMVAIPPSTIASGGAVATGASIVFVGTGMAVAKGMATGAFGVGADAGMDEGTFTLVACWTCGGFPTRNGIFSSISATSGGVLR